MTADEVATEITKAWLAQLSGRTPPHVTEELKKVYAAAVEAYLEGWQKVKEQPK